MRLPPRRAGRNGAPAGIAPVEKRVSTTSRSACIGGDQTEPGTPAAGRHARPRAGRPDRGRQSGRRRPGRQPTRCRRPRRRAPGPRGPRPRRSDGPRSGRPSSARRRTGARARSRIAAGSRQTSSRSPWRSSRQPPSVRPVTCRSRELVEQAAEAGLARRIGAGRRPRAASAARRGARSRPRAAASPACAMRTNPSRTDPHMLREPGANLALPCGTRGAMAGRRRASCADIEAWSCRSRPRANAAARLLGSTSQGWSSGPQGGEQPRPWAPPAAAAAAAARPSRAPPPCRRARRGRCRAPARIATVSA